MEPFFKSSPELEELLREVGRLAYEQRITESKLEELTNTGSPKHELAAQKANLERVNQQLAETLKEFKKHRL